MIVGAVVAIGSMIAFGLQANEQIFFGLGASLVVYLLVSLFSPATEPGRLATWTRRMAGADSDAPAPVR